MAKTVTGEECCYFCGGLIEWETDITNQEFVSSRVRAIAFVRYALMNRYDHRELNLEVVVGCPHCSTNNKYCYSYDTVTGLHTKRHD